MKRKILIIAKTYPVNSKKYGELVCTAGITEDKKWIRLYPIPYRSLNRFMKYKKYQWVETDIEKDISDPRIESYKVIDCIKPLDFIDTKYLWKERKRFILSNYIYTNKNLLLCDCRKKIKPISLAIFRPSKIISLEIKEVKNIEILQDNLTETMPFTCFYTFIDDKGIKSRLQIIDWEMAELTRKLVKKYKSDYSSIKRIIKQKYFYEMTKKDIYFFLGTNRLWHIRKSYNPFMIIGIFYPPFDKNN